MDGMKIPLSLNDWFGGLGARLVPMALGVVALLAAGNPTHASAQDPERNVDIGRDGVGVPPPDFDVRSGRNGRTGQWVVVHDATAADGLAIEQSGADRTQDLFPLAVYESASLKNLDISFRFKAVAGGTAEGGGVAVRLSSPRDYYVVEADAYRNRDFLSHVTNGRFEEIAAVEADIAEKTWHTFDIQAEDDRFAASLDGVLLFTGYDASFARAGRIVLWARAGSVTRFDRIAITPLPASE
jgi:hypothetical protein